VTTSQASTGLILFLVSIFSSSAQELSYVGGGHTESYVFQGPVPFWNGAAMIKLDGDAINSWAEDGRQLLVATVQIPESSALKVFDATAKIDGSLVACGAAKDRDGRKGGFLYFIRPDRTEPRIVRTAPYVPAKVAIASDNSIWTAGYDANLYAVRDKKTTIIRHFDASGRLLEGFVRQASFQDRGIELPGSGLGAFALSSSGVAAWIGPHAQVYVEVTGGQVHEYAGVPLGDNESVQGLVVLGSGAAIVSVLNNRLGLRLYILNRSAGSWQTLSLPVAWSIKDTASLLGQFGDKLVLQSKNRLDFQFATIK